MNTLIPGSPDFVLSRQPQFSLAGNLQLGFELLLHVNMTASHPNVFFWILLCGLPGTVVPCHCSRNQFETLDLGLPVGGSN